MPLLEIIIASTRPGRVGASFGAWFADQARAHGGFDVELVDLVEVALPLFDEPNHPRMATYTHQHTVDWSATVTRADAFVFVTPEYNHGYPASLKNAIDYLHNEWRGKALGFVSYGGVAAGTRAVQQLKQVANSVGLVVVGSAVNIPNFAQFLAEDGSVKANDIMIDSAKAMLDELQRTTATLRP